MSGDGGMVGRFNIGVNEFFLVVVSFCFFEKFIFGFVGSLLLVFLCFCLLFLIFEFYNDDILGYFFRRYEFRCLE